MKQIILLLLFLIVTPTFNSIGCDCLGEVGFKDAALVFIGKVLKIEDKGKVKITFRVFKVEKGKHKRKQVVVFTPCLTDGCCGVDFQKDSVYKVFAIVENKVYETHLCTQTHKISANESK